MYVLPLCTLVGLRGIFICYDFFIKITPSAIKIRHGITFPISAHNNPAIIKNIPHALNITEPTLGGT